MSSILIVLSLPLLFSGDVLYSLFMETTTAPAVPRDFIWRKLHSLAGFGLVIFLFIHLFTNSQAALYIGDDGRGFIHAVNAIHELPYLQVVEIVLIALPILIHIAYGIHRLRLAKANSFSTDGSKPSLPDYPRNRAYTWQRITSWLLILGILAHVVHMRFVESPLVATEGEVRAYAVHLTEDPGLPSVAERLGVKLYPQGQGEVLAVAPNFGTADLLVVRDTFKDPVMMILYTIFVLAATFHAFNGMWTFMISWGVTLSQRAQKLMRYLTVSLMLLVSGFGIAAIWLTYWVNLKT